MENNNNLSFKEKIIEFLENKQVDKIKELINLSNQDEILDLLLDMNEEDQAIVFLLLSKEKALFVFEHLDLSSQEHLIQSIAADKAKDLIENLAPDDRVALFEELPAKVVKKMLADLSQSERDATNLLLGYAPETAGRIMTPEYVRVTRDMTIKEALAKTKKTAKDKETIYTIFVTDKERKFEGVLSLKDLIIADDNALIETIMQPGSFVYTNTDQEEVARTLQKFGLLSIPVLDLEDRLVGIVTIDDALDILEEEATEDMIGKSSEILIKGSVKGALLRRLPFLLIALIGGILAAMLLEGFEYTLETILAAAFFIPLIMDLGGSVGVQSSTIFIRGNALGQIDDKIGKHLAREAFIGFLIGAIVGVIAGFTAFVWQYLINNEPAGLYLSFAIAAALVIMCTFAAFMGYLIPFALKKIKLDQASVTGPIITTIKDVIGLLIYFSLVVLFVSVIGGYAY